MFLKRDKFSVYLVEEGTACVRNDKEVYQKDGVELQVYANAVIHYPSICYVLLAAIIL
jgi:hypothetical protein